MKNSSTIYVFQYLCSSIFVSRWKWCNSDEVLNQWKWMKLHKNLKCTFEPRYQCFLDWNKRNPIPQLSQSLQILQKVFVKGWFWKCIFIFIFSTEDLNIWYGKFKNFKQFSWFWMLSKLCKICLYYCTKWSPWGK